VPLPCPGPEKLSTKVSGIQGLLGLPNKVVELGPRFFGPPMTHPAARSLPPNRQTAGHHRPPPRAGQTDPGLAPGRPAEFSSRLLRCVQRLCGQSARPLLVPPFLWKSASTVEGAEGTFAGCLGVSKPGVFSRRSVDQNGPEACSMGSFEGAGTDFQSRGNFFSGQRQKLS